MVLGKDIYTFVRFGGLDIKPQKGYKSENELLSSTNSYYHSPPTTRGFYAMPKIAQEFFLIGSLGKTQPANIGKKELNIDKLRQLRKEFRKDRGEIWHHLIEETKPQDVLMRHGSWIKTDIKVWAKSFRKMSVILRYGREKYDLENGINAPGTSNGVIGNYSKDHCEVFFDTKV